ncbi:hypothetical protein D0T84_11320 [Dysgonomonas sp. 521]|uniref:hypothetical protein n=1 Tax=Dysgonomonas sp. 521 TaxID=2302932 RepID=UPI0013D1582B|nr:hypothetical protein [Dysgonomonas sp. 521]NDV95494.1 hypothetical protein [Dysgonomonas sp. 521]
MEVQKFNLFINQNNIPDKSDIGNLEKLVFEYPYFQAAIFAYLKALYIHTPGNYQKELERLSITVRDRRALFYYIFSEEFDRFFMETGKKEIPEDKTNILLNAFFESRGETLDDDMQLEYNISHSSLASTDYFSYIQVQPEDEEEKEERKTEDNPQLRHHDIIDSFINKSEEEGIHIQIQEDHTYTRNVDNTEENDEEDNKDELNEDIFFTETLAKIYIKQHKYDKAYKIIKHLSLNYPKKNIYFADQLSFLEKLIINSKYKDKK